MHLENLINNSSSSVCRKLSTNRKKDLLHFYSILNDLKYRIGGERKLGDRSAKMGCPLRGVYFFFEKDEHRTDSEENLRVVRVGSHAVTEKANSLLWQRLRQHRNKNHRSSVFRRLVGRAIIKSESIAVPTWGDKLIRDKETEYGLEQRVSGLIEDMPFIWLPVDDTGGSSSLPGYMLRGYIERNSIAILSNYNKIDVMNPPSKKWLGKSSDSDLVRESGLWNQNHVSEEYDESFLENLESLVRKIEA